MWEFLTFSFPFVWQGSCAVKTTTVITFFMMFLSKACNISHPLVLRAIVTAIMCDEDKNGEDTCPSTQDIYMLIILYAGLKFIAEFIQYLREIPFAYMVANAEKHVAVKVFDHVQRQSLSFHLKRETGKIIRTVQKGACAFADVLRFMFFNLAPIVLEIVFVVAVVGTLYPYYFCLLVLGTILTYLFVTFCVTEWRA